MNHAIRVAGIPKAPKPSKICQSSAKNTRPGRPGRVFSWRAPAAMVFSRYERGTASSRCASAFARSQSRGLGQIDPEAIAAVLIASRHFGAGVAELRVHKMFVDFGRRGEPGAQGMSREFARAFAFAKIAAHAGGQCGFLDQPRGVIVGEPLGADFLAGDATEQRAVREVSRDAIAALRAAGLIAAGPRSPQPGAPYNFVTTPGFLAHFGFKSLRDLEDFEQLQDAGLLERVDGADIARALGLDRETEDRAPRGTAGRRNRCGTEGHTLCFRVP